MIRDVWVCVCVFLFFSLFLSFSLVSVDATDDVVTEKKMIFIFHLRSFSSTFVELCAPFNVELLWYNYICCLLLLCFLYNYVPILDIKMYWSFIMRTPSISWRISCCSHHTLTFAPITLIHSLAFSLCYFI